MIFRITTFIFFVAIVIAVAAYKNRTEQPQADAPSSSGAPSSQFNLNTR